MISIQNLHKNYGKQILFDGASLQMAPRERLGLVGRNGHGKSTLFRIILGEEELDGGNVTFPRNYRIGHLAQHIKFSKPTVLEEGCLGLPEGEEWDHYKVESILFGLGFSKADMDRPPESFSGGYQVRLMLAKVLVSQPNLLLLDEPTNYLDIVSIRWVEQFLRQWPNELMVISHDRDFMDAVTTHTAAIHREKIRRIEGNTAKLYSQIAQDEEIYEKTRQNEVKRRKQIQSFVDRFRAQATKASAVQSRVKMLDRMPAQERLAKIEELEFDFHYSPFPAKVVMDVQGLAFGYPRPAGVVREPDLLFRDLNLTINAQDRIAVIGKNGRGKSTLLNVLAGEARPVVGTIRSHPDMKLGYFGQTNIDRLSPKLTVEDEIGSSNMQLNRTAVRTLCGVMMFSGDAAEKRISVLSGGERSRVLLGKILAQPANLLFLDEPTNHLDMASIQALVEAIQVFEGAVVLVTHSEMILREVANKLVVFQGGKAEVFLGGYDEFLDRIGWRDEDEEGASGGGTSQLTPAEAPPAPQENTNKKESRRERAELIAEKSKVLNPLKAELDTLEEEICRFEEDLKKANDELASSSQQKDVGAFVALSKRIKEAQKEIDRRFERLETVTKTYEDQKRKYEEI